MKRYLAWPWLLEVSLGIYLFVPRLSFYWHKPVESSIWEVKSSRDVFYSTEHAEKQRKLHVFYRITYFKIIFCLYIFQEDNDLDKSSTAMKLVSTVRKVLECPVCLEMVTAPARTCVSGHVTCASCATKLTSCGLCRQPMLREQPTCLNSLLEVLPRQCRYSDEGCKVVFAPEDSSHEQFCGFRTMQCRACKMKTMIKVKDIRQHYKEVHEYKCVVNNLSKSLTKHFIPKSKTVAYLPVLCFESNFFYVKMVDDLNEGNLKVTFEAFLEDKPDYDYFVKVTFLKDTLEYTWTIKATLSTQEASADIQEKHQFCFTIPTFILQNLTDDTNKFKFNLTFLQLPI